MKMYYTNNEVKQELIDFLTWYKDYCPEKIPIEDVVNHYIGLIKDNKKRS